MKHVNETTINSASNLPQAQQAQPDTTTPHTQPRAPSLNQRDDAPQDCYLSTLPRDCLNKLGRYLCLRSWIRLRSSSKSLQLSMSGTAPFSCKLNRKLSASLIESMLKKAGDSESKDPDPLKTLENHMTALGNCIADIAIDLPKNPGDHRRKHSPELYSLHLANALARATGWKSMLITSRGDESGTMLPFLRTLREASFFRNTQEVRKLSLKHLRLSPAVSEEMNQLFKTPGFRFDEIDVHASSALDLVPPHPEWMKQANLSLDLTSSEISRKSLSAELDALKTVLPEVGNLRKLYLFTADEAENYNELLPVLNDGLKKNTSLHSLTLSPHKDDPDFEQVSWDAVLRHPSLSRLSLTVPHTWKVPKKTTRTAKHLDYLELDLFAENGYVGNMMSWLQSFLACLGSVDHLEINELHDLVVHGDVDEYEKLITVIHQLGVRTLTLSGFTESFVDLKLPALLEGRIESLELSAIEELSCVKADGLKCSLESNTSLTSLDIDVRLLPYDELIEGLQGNTALRHVSLDCAFVAEGKKLKFDALRQARIIEAVFRHPNICDAKITIASKAMRMFCVEHLADLKPSLNIRFFMNRDDEAPISFEEGMNKLKALEQELKTQYPPQ